MAERSWTISPVRWLVLLGVLCATLLVGSGIFSASPPTEQQRIATIEASLKCPSCQDLSVAESTSPSSLAIRHQVTQGVRAGESDAAIISALQARYGATVELTPTGGLSTILVAVPLALLAGLVVVVVLGLRRRKGGAA
jgi:cytochrome c-type biogenesis protein CcmH